jgi:hypothetical protein
VLLLLGSLEELSIEEFKEQFQTNFLMLLDIIQNQKALLLKRIIKYLST